MVQEFGAGQRDYDELVELADRAMPKQKDSRDMPLFAKLMEAEDKLTAAPETKYTRGMIYEAGSVSAGRIPRFFRGFFGLNGLVLSAGVLRVE